MKKVLFMMIITFGMAVIFAGCGTNDSAANTSKNTEAPKKTITVTDLAGKEVTFDEVPKRVVSLTAGDLETLHDLGVEAVGRPVIRGDVADYAKDIPEVGTTHDINMEKIASLNPDAIIAHPGLNAKDIPALEEMGIPVIRTGANSIDEIKTSISMFGTIFQKEDKAKAWNKKIDDKVNALQTKDTEQLRSLVVFGVAGNWMVALPDSLSGNLLEAAGEYNVAKDYPKLDRFPHYAQVDVEKIVKSNPKAIFFITPGQQEKAVEGFSKEMKKNPAWESIDAVKNNHFISLPNELFGANPGSKVVDSLDYLSKKMQEIN